MGLITLPYSLTAHADAKAAEVMADFNKLLTLVNGNLDSENLATNAVGTAELQDGAVTKAKQATGYSRKMTVGTQAFSIGTGFSYSAAFNVAHGLGETPTHFSPQIASAETWQITMDCRLLLWDATNVRVQVIGSSPTPGGVGEGSYSFTLYWACWGQP